MAPLIWNIAQSANSITCPTRIVNPVNLAWDGTNYWCVGKHTGGARTYADIYYCSTLNGVWAIAHTETTGQLTGGGTTTAACCYNTTLGQLDWVMLTSRAGGAIKGSYYSAAWHDYVGILGVAGDIDAFSNAMIHYPLGGVSHVSYVSWSGKQAASSACFVCQTMDNSGFGSISDTESTIATRAFCGPDGSLYYATASGKLKKCTSAGVLSTDSTGYSWAAFALGDNNGYIRQNGVEVVQTATYIYFRALGATSFAGITGLANGITCFTGQSAQWSQTVAGIMFDGTFYPLINGIVGTQTCSSSVITGSVNGIFYDATYLWTVSPTADGNYLEGGSLSFIVGQAPNGRYKRKVNAVNNEFIILYDNAGNRLGGFWWKNTVQSGSEYSGDLISPFSIDCLKSVSATYTTQYIPAIFASLLSTVGSYCSSTGVNGTQQTITFNQRQLPDCLTMAANLDGHVWWQDFNDVIHEDAESTATGLSVVFGTQYMGEPSRRYVSLQLSYAKIWYGIGTGKSSYIAVGQLGSGNYETWFPNYTLAQTTTYANSLVAQNQQPIQWIVPGIVSLAPIQIGETIQFGYNIAPWNQSTATFYVQRNDYDLDAQTQTLVLNDGFYYNMNNMNPQNRNDTQQNTIKSQVSNLNDAVNQVATNSIQITNSGNNVSDPTLAQDVVTQNFLLTTHGLDAGTKLRYVPLDQNDTAGYDAQYHSATTADTVEMDFINGGSANKSAGTTEDTTPQARCPAGTVAIHIKLASSVDTANANNEVDVFRLGNTNLQNGVALWAPMVGGYVNVVCGNISVGAGSHVKLKFTRGAGTIYVYIKVLGYYI
jgi:hypothetical protein